MIAGCNGICMKYKYKKTRVTDSPYLDGAKFCRNCGMFIVYGGVYCPCCKKALRSRPRAREQRITLHQRLEKLRRGKGVVVTAK